MELNCPKCGSDDIVRYSYLDEYACCNVRCGKIFRGYEFEYIELNLRKEKDRAREFFKDHGNYYILNRKMRLRIDDEAKVYIQFTIGKELLTEYEISIDMAESFKIIFKKT